MKTFLILASLLLPFTIGFAGEKKEVVSRTPEIGPEAKL